MIQPTTTGPSVGASDAIAPMAAAAGGERSKGRSESARRRGVDDPLLEFVTDYDPVHPRRTA